MMPHAAKAATTTTMNWSGSAATGTAGSFTSGSSSWVQPAVTCGTADTFSSFWVGLDGIGTPTIEQTGTEADCSDCSDGTAAYGGWFEIFPAAPVFYDKPVRPGDAMSAAVTSDGNGAFTLTLTDTTTKWTETTKRFCERRQASVGGDHRRGAQQSVGPATGRLRHGALHRRGGQRPTGR
jgi:Peptidase A4 family